MGGRPYGLGLTAGPGSARMGRHGSTTSSASAASQAEQEVDEGLSLESEEPPLEEDEEPEERAESGPTGDVNQTPRGKAAPSSNPFSLKEDSKPSEPVSRHFSLSRALISASG